MGINCYNSDKMPSGVSGTMKPLEEVFKFDREIFFFF